jgi:hypothetical protein
MAKQFFSYKEVIAYGWQMTKKYWKVIFIYIVVCIAVELFDRAMQSFDVSDSIQRNEISDVYQDPIQADKFYRYLQDTGYINRSGKVLEKLQKTTNLHALELSPDFENNRYHIYRFLNNYRYRLPFPKSIYYVLMYVMIIVYMLMAIGFTQGLILISRDKEPDIAELLKSWRFLISFVLGWICSVFIIFVGFILFIIPGFIFMIGTQFWYFLVVDKGLGPIKALKRSWIITKGSKGRLAVLGLLLMLLNIAGFLCLIVGLFFTIPISLIATARVYNILESARV